MGITHIQVEITIRFKFKLNTAFIQRSTGEYFLCVRWNNCFQNWDFIKNPQKFFCKSSEPKMTTLVYTHFILSKVNLRECLVFELTLREIALLVLRLDFFSISQLLSNCYCPANFLSFFRQLTTSSIPGAEILTKSAPFFFQQLELYFFW